MLHGLPCRLARIEQLSDVEVEGWINEERREHELESGMKETCSADESSVDALVGHTVHQEVQRSLKRKGNILKRVMGGPSER